MLSAKQNLRVGANSHLVGRQMGCRAAMTGWHHEKMTGTMVADKIYMKIR